MVNRFLALHPHCVSFDPGAVAKVLRWFRQQHTQRLFTSIRRPRTCFSFFFTPLYHQREVVFIGLGSAGRNVWLSVCVCVCSFLPEHVDPVSAITTGNDQPFALKSQQRFSLFLLSPETQGDRTAAAAAPTLHCWCFALTLCSPLRALPPKRLLECRTSDY